MGCTSSKKVLRTRSFQQNLHRPFPRVAAIPIIEDFLFANNHEQFMGLICKNNNSSMQIFTAARKETLPSLIGKDNEGEGTVKENPEKVSDLQSGSFLRGEESGKHRPEEEESEERKFIEEESERDKTKEEQSEECKTTEEEPEKCKLTEEAEKESKDCKFKEEKNLEIIKTWELMEGLEDGETDHTSEKFIDLGDKTRVIRTGRRSKSMEYFHTLEEYDRILAGSKTPLWDRNSKRYLHYLCPKALENVTEFTLRCVVKTDSLPPKPSNITPIVIDWKEESMDNHIFVLESSILKADSDLRDTGNKIINQGNISIAEVVPENIIKQENNHLIETNERNIYSAGINLKKDQSSVIDWKEESKDKYMCALESSALQADSNLRDAGNEIISRENSSIAEVAPENIRRQEDNHFVEEIERKIFLSDINSEKDQSTIQNSSKRSLRERVKLNDIGGINIPSTPNFSAVGSLRDWLKSGGNLYSPGLNTTPSFGSYIHGDQWSSNNPAGYSEQFRIAEAEIDTHSFSSHEMNKKETIVEDSSVSSFSNPSVSAIRNENWDTPLFDPELLASFEKALEQLSNEEKCLLRLMDDSSHFLNVDCHPEGNEDGLHDSSRVENISIQSNCPS